MDEICELNIPTGVPLIYDLDEDLKPVPHKLAISPLQGYYLGDQVGDSNPPFPRMGHTLQEAGWPGDVLQTEQALTAPLWVEKQTDKYPFPLDPGSNPNPDPRPPEPNQEKILAKI